jgi:replicative DNA helicase
MNTLERAVIAGVINAPRELNNVRAILPGPEYFGVEQNKRLYGLVLKCFEEHGTVDLPLLDGKVTQEEMADLCMLTDKVDGYNVISHAKRVAECAARRDAALKLSGLTSKMQEEPDVYEAIGTAQRDLADIKARFTVNSAKTAKEIVHNINALIDRIYAGDEISIPFGFYDLDKQTGGIDPTDLVVIAGREKSGKTTLMIQVVFHNARLGHPVLIESAEMSAEQIFLRVAMLEEKLSWVELKRKRMSPHDVTRLHKKLEELHGLPVFVRTGVFDIVDIMDDAARYVEQHGVKLICVDYIQRVVPVTKGGNENREREVAGISSGLKGIAMKHGVPVLALSQVNDDLRARESRAIEQDMDKMLTVDNAPKNKGETQEMRPVTYEVDILLRQRMGASGAWGDVKLLYDVMNGGWRNLTGHTEQIAPPYSEPVHEDALF